MDAQQLGEPHVAVGHQGQRREKVLAELAVAVPRTALLVALERERIDQDRPALEKLDVVGARVLERHVVAQGRLLNSEGGERRVLELAEAPLVGIGEEGDLLGAQRQVGLAGARSRILDLLVGDEQPLARELLVEPGRHQPIVMGCVAAVDPAVDDAVAGEDEAAGIPEGGAEDLVIHRRKRNSLTGLARRRHRSRARGSP